MTEDKKVVLVEKSFFSNEYPYRNTNDMMSVLFQVNTFLAGNINKVNFISSYTYILSEGGVCMVIYYEELE